MDVSETATERRAAADPTSDLEDKTEAQHIRMALLGKTGTGKSNLAETILGEKVFEIYHTANSGTSECQKVTRQVGDANITLIDTPGFFDKRKSDDALKSEIIDAIIEGSEGIDAFLILFKVERFTEQENKVVSKIKDYFSDEAFKHAVVVFTHGDQLNDNMKIEQFVSENQYLCDLLEKCGKRCCVVDNKYWKNNQQDEYRNNQVQVAKLLQTVKEMVRNRGRYTNGMLQIVKRMIMQQVQRILRLAVDMPIEAIWSWAKSNVSDVLKKLAGVTTGVFLGAFLGVPHMVASVILALGEDRAITALYGLSVTASVVDGTLHVAAASGVLSYAAAASDGILPVAAASDGILPVAAASDGILPVAAASGVTLFVAAASDVLSDAAAASDGILPVAAASGVTLPVAAGVYAATGAVVGSCIGYKEADKADSVQEAMKNTAEALIKPIRQVLEGPNITH